MKIMLLQLVAKGGPSTHLSLISKRRVYDFMEIGYPMYRSARRSRPAKKRLNKRMVQIFIAVFILIGATQAYAAVLDTSIIDLIKSGVKVVADAQVLGANAQSTAIETDYKTKLQATVTATKTSANNDLAQFTESELTRARNELAAYLDDKKQQMNNVVSPQVELSKQDITRNVNAIIDAIKQHLDVEFQRQLNESWKR
jgi:hypothetical protein